jgi:formylglycine-generating enzyme required for sulfatase activity/serine/threonine protein kinase
MVNNGLKYLVNLAPGGEILYDVATDAWQDYRGRLRKEQHLAQGPTPTPEAAFRVEVEALALAPADRLRAAAVQTVRQEAADQPAEVQQALTTYLTQIPAMIRRSLRRPSDLTGTTVPQNRPLSSAEDLLTFLPPQPPRFRPGDRPLPGVDRELVELLGVGGFGEVWKARNPFKPSARPVALKFCLDPGAAEVLRHEAAILDRVESQGRHAGIVALQHTYLSAEPPCLEYEYVEGGDLTGLIHELHHNGRRSVSYVATVVLRLAKIVAFAHRLDEPIVHRDLKPANILWQRTPDGKLQLKIADFGIGGRVADAALRKLSSRPSSHAESLTTALRGAHTPLYASPQQVRGELPDPRDDVYALGIIWYQLLTGDLTMFSLPADWQKKARKRGLGVAMLEVLDACLASEPDERLANAAVLGERLAPLLNDQSAPQPPPEPTDDLAAQIQRTPQQIAQAHEWSSSRPQGTAHAKGSEREQAEGARKRRALNLATLGACLLVALGVRLVVAFASRPRDAASIAARGPGTTDKAMEEMPGAAEGMAVKAKEAGRPRPEQGGEFTNSIGMQLVPITAGVFDMGADNTQDRDAFIDERPRHKVRIARPFLVAAHKTTQAQFAKVTGRNPSYFSATGGGKVRVVGEDTGRFPVECVNWFDAVEFCNKLSAAEGRQPCYRLSGMNRAADGSIEAAEVELLGAGTGYRLPTEAEWECCARAGTSTKYWFGMDTAQFGEHGWFKGNSGYHTHLVGEKKPNPWGLYDMGRLLYEWCEDVYHWSYNGAPADGSAWLTGDGSHRILRGGSWGGPAGWCRPARRFSGAPGAPSDHVGVRVVLVSP